MAKDQNLWNRILRNALALPGVAIDRDEYLRSALRNDCTPEELSRAIEYRPAVVVSRERIDKIASAAINYHTATVTSLSTLTGLPGGPAIVASIPADLAQYYFHVFSLSQKLAYLYGFPDLRDKNARLTDEAADMLTLFVGVMMGARVASNVLRDISRDLAVQVAKKVPTKTLTRTLYYPIVRQVATRIGLDLSKSNVTRTLGRFIPLVGGIVSGAVTYAAFYPGARRLQKTLHRQMDLLGANPDQMPDTGDVLPPSDEHLERLAMQALVNMALMDDDAREKKLAYLQKQVAHTTLPLEEQQQLVAAYQEAQTFKTDFADFQDDPVSSSQLVRRLVDVMRLGGQISVSAKIYLNKICRELGYSPRDVDEFLKG